MEETCWRFDGFELADIIRQHPRYQKTAIIFISAVHLTDLDQLKGYERGAVDYISVPGSFRNSYGPKSVYLPSCTARRISWNG